MGLFFFFLTVCIEFLLTATFLIPADRPFVHSYLNLSTTATFPQPQHPLKRVSDFFVDLDPQYVFCSPAAVNDMERPRERSAKARALILFYLKTRGLNSVVSQRVSFFHLALRMLQSVRRVCVNIRGGKHKVDSLKVALPICWSICRQF